MRTHENTCADCGDTVAGMSEPEPGTSLCYSCATPAPETKDSAPNLIYTDLGLDITGDHDDVFVIDPDTLSLSDADREILETADSFGSFGPDAAAIVRRVGVPLADLWAAYRREQQPVGSDGWRWQRGWQHCNIHATYDDDGATCQICHRFLTWEQADVLMAE